MPFLLTGGCGFVGSNIAAALLRSGKQVTVVDNLSRTGAAANLDWLQTLGKLDFVNLDVRIGTEVDELFKGRQFECVFHLAGQVAMTASLRSPRRDFEVNVVGSINILEAARNFAPGATIVYASTNKVYGDLEQLALEETPTRYRPSANGQAQAIDESAALDFRTPYGCSKGAADQYMLEYARNFGLKTVVFRHSTIYGGRQISTFDQGWVGWFCQQALAVTQNQSHRFTINGNGKQVRDLLYVSDAVQCYLSAHQNIANAAGNVFNIGGGVENSMSLLELFEYLQSSLDVRLTYEQLPWRNNDQRYFVADNAKAERLLGWRPCISKEEGIQATLRWEADKVRM